MKKRGVDAVIEIDRLLEEYNPYYDAQLNFLLKRMVRENDRRQYDYKKKVEQIRQDFREGAGQFANIRRKERKFMTGIKPPWEIEKEKREEERKRRLYSKIGQSEAEKDDAGTKSADTDEAPESE